MRRFPNFSSYLPIFHQRPAAHSSADPIEAAGHLTDNEDSVSIDVLRAATQAGDWASVEAWLKNTNTPLLTTEHAKELLTLSYQYCDPSSPAKKQADQQEIRFALVARAHKNNRDVAVASWFDASLQNSARHAGDIPLLRFVNPTILEVVNDTFPIIASHLDSRSIAAFKESHSRINSAVNSASTRLALKPEILKASREELTKFFDKRGAVTELDLSALHACSSEEVVAFIARMPPAAQAMIKSLDLSQAQDMDTAQLQALLDRIPDGVAANIKSLDFSGVLLAGVNLSRFTALESLDFLSKMQEMDAAQLQALLDSIPDSAAANIKSLKLSGSLAAGVNLSRFTALESLDLSTATDMSATQLQALLDSIPASATAMIKSLDLSDLLLVGLNLGRFTALESLDLSGATDMSAGQAQKMNATQVQALLNSIPASATAKIKSLDLSHLSLVGLNLGSFTALESLSLSWATDMSAGQEQDMNAAQVQALLNSIPASATAKIKSLDLSHLSLVGLNLGSFTALESLSLSWATDMDATQVQTLLDSIPASATAKIKSLNLSQLLRAGLNLGRFTALESLDLSNLHAPLAQALLDSIPDSAAANIKSLKLVGELAAGVNLSRFTALESLSLTCAYGRNTVQTQALLDSIPDSAAANIKSLKLSGALAANVNLSRFTALESLEFSAAQDMSDAQMQTLLDRIPDSATAKIKSLYFKVSGVNLSRFTALESLKLSYVSSIRATQIQALLDSIPDSVIAKMKVLDLRVVRLTGVDISRFTARGVEVLRR